MEKQSVMTQLFQTEVHVMTVHSPIPVVPTQTQTNFFLFYSVSCYLGGKRNLIISFHFPVSFPKEFLDFGAETPVYIL